MQLDFVSANADDAWDFADLHRKCYASETHFIACFPRDLLGDYYRLFLEGGFVVIKAKASMGDRINGFVVAGSGLAEKISFFKKNNKKRILKTAALHPRTFLKKIIEILFYRYRGASAFFEPCPFLILSIVSDRTEPGIGAALLKKTQELCRQSGNEKIGLYVRVDNLRALHFYLKNSFMIKGYTTGQFYMEAEV